jgi:nitrate/TMAO reductase-like tetraheme cytochrome c subunit/mono/diheme cytochrome c family protein
MLERLRRFFFPPPERSRLRRYGPLALVVAVPVFILLAIPPAWEYSNTAEFCGETCHTMPPEYSTYLVSPHARVLCVDCHIGRDWIAKQAIRKTSHLELIYKTITGDYTYPIIVGSMRPARETCERCHYPQKFSDDSLRLIHRYGDDANNTPYDLYLLMHTGGGTAREGLGLGIHWHIENKIEYITTDKEEQDIQWIRVNQVDGTTVEYTAENATIDTSNLGQYKIHEMDCITCHNRISHLIPTPRDVVDEALYRGDLPADIPYIRAQAVDVLSPEYETPAEAKQAIAQLTDYYQTNYPEFYAANADKVASAIQLLGQLYDQNTYPDQKLDWTTHPDNVGHRDSAGCFRCHDGKHFNAEGVAIRLECNLCHSIPQIVKPDEIEPMLPLTTGLEPPSHLDSTWISRHHNELDETCAACHTVENAGGTTDTSFCSNSGCHGVEWRFADFDAPALAVELGGQQPPPQVEPELPAAGEPVTYQTLQPIFQQKCGQCHGETPTKGLRLIDYAGIMAGSVDGPVVLPGNPDESLIVIVQSGKHFGQLTDEQLALVRQWIADGATEGGTTAPSGEEPATPPSAEPATPEATATVVPPEATPEATATEGGFSWGDSGTSSTPVPPTETPTPEATATGPGFSWGGTSTPEGASGFSWGN